VALCELDVVLGADIGELRVALGSALDGGATLGLSSSLLGTLHPLAMPGGFRPFDLRQPDLLVWLDGPDPGSCAEEADTVVASLAGPTALRRRMVGPVRVLADLAPSPAPALADGPAAGGTYVIVVAEPEPDLDPDLVVDPHGPDRTGVLLRADLGVLGDLDARTVAHGGLYLAVDRATARRLAAPARG
jgi:hypothetical protein